MSRWGSDDLFYYSQVAGNLSHGLGLTFDGDTPTNGFQPLYLALLVPFGRALHNDPVLATYIVLGLVTVLSLLAAWQLVLLGEEAEVPTFGWAAAVVWLVHPKLLSVTFNGTEAALTMLVLVLALRACIWVHRDGETRAASLIFACLVLCRLDLGVFLLIVGAALARSGCSARAWFALFTPAVAVMGALLAFNLLQFGHALPDSGVAKGLHAAVLQEVGLAPPWDAFAAQVGRALGKAEGATAWSVWVPALMGGVVTLRRRVLRRGVGLLLVGGVAVVCADFVRVGGFREWYLMPLYLALVITTSAVIEALWQRGPALRVVAVALLIVWWQAAAAHPRQHMAPSYLRAAAAVRETWPAGIRIGAFNSGLYGAALGDTYQVINLDGVVNHEVLPYLRTRRLDTYLRSKRIDALLDHRGTLRFFGRFAAMPLASSGTSDIQVGTDKSAGILGIYLDY